MIGKMLRGGLVASLVPVFAVLLQCTIPVIHSFSPPNCIPAAIFRIRSQPSREDGDVVLDEMSASTPANTSIPSALPQLQSVTKDESIEQVEGNASSPAAVVTMITQDSRRILIEELGYRRADVSRLRPELAQAILAKRLVAPNIVPDSWFLAEEDDVQSAMRNRLASESRFPLKFPLLGISTIVFGKGFGDFLVTSIKVSTNFPGSSWGEEFMGVPVILIDVVCIILGGGLFSWTWSSMRSEGNEMF